MLDVENSTPPKTLALADCVDRLLHAKSGRRPVSTYRLQLNADFRFEDARQLLPYLHALGVTHCYASPILKARAGSQHGYDITNHNEINPEIGTPEELDAFVRELKALGMGLILDIVPNHMGIGHGTNPWWQDVLENGQASAYADFFDIDWNPVKNELSGKVLLPVLGNSYGEELEQGRMQLQYAEGSFFISYFDKRFPIDPQTYSIVLGLVRVPEQSDSGEVAEIHAFSRAFQALPPHNSVDPEIVKRRQTEIPLLKKGLASLLDRFKPGQALVEAAIRQCQGDPADPRSFDLLHRLLEAQAYRLAHWRVSAEEINYRRFFDINDLVGLRMENPKVFAETHKLIRRLLAEEKIDGLRMDHPDGLFNPVQYFSRIQMLFAASQCSGPEPQSPLADTGIEEEVVSLLSTNRESIPSAPLYVLAEKILESGEHLPSNWPIDGTVGYEFGNTLNNLFIDQRAKRQFSNYYRRFIGGPIDINEVIYESKRMILRYSLASELNVLMHMLEEISSTDRRARDFTRSLLREGIREAIACFPVYRTYIDARGTISDRDRAYIQETIARAKRRNQSTNPAAFDFLRSVLLLENVGNSSAVEQYRRCLRFVLKFQQLTGPVMAKGLEDTACYVYSRFISVNEVGGSPAQFGVPLEEFHAANQERARDWPHSMLATSTHDSKRSEDVRARLNVLSEMPQQWWKQVTRWRRNNRAKKKTLGDVRIVPDANEEYFLYQTLVGAWPLTQLEDEGQYEEFVQRIQDYMIKAIHEAKVNLSWTNQNPEYVDAMKQFIARVLSRGEKGRPNNFLRQFEEFIRPVKFFGCLNGLAQVLLKVTSPGVPDVYRGTEAWDLSLVDPDNRRPVDYGTRQHMLAELLKHDRDQDLLEFCADLLRDLADGRAKMWTTLRSLRFRRDHPELFRNGQYLPLYASERVRESVVAFMWQQGQESAITVAPRFPYTLTQGEMRVPLGAQTWGDEEIRIPTSAAREWRNVFTGEMVQANDSRLLCREVFGTFPLALLAAD